MTAKGWLFSFHYRPDAFPQARVLRQGLRTGRWGCPPVPSPRRTAPASGSPRRAPRRRCGRGSPAPAAPSPRSGTHPPRAAGGALWRHEPDASSFRGAGSRRSSPGPGVVGVPWASSARGGAPVRVRTAASTPLSAKPVSSSTNCRTWPSSSMCRSSCSFWGVNKGMTFMLSDLAYIQQNV